MCQSICLFIYLTSCVSVSLSVCLSLHLLYIFFQFFLASQNYIFAKYIYLQKTSVRPCCFKKAKKKLKIKKNNIYFFWGRVIIIDIKLDCHKISVYMTVNETFSIIINSSSNNIQIRCTLLY